MNIFLIVWILRHAHDFVNVVDLEDSLTEAIIGDSVIEARAIDLRQKAARLSCVVTLLEKQINVSLRVLKRLADAFYFLQYKARPQHCTWLRKVEKSPGNIAYHCPSDHSILVQQPLGKLSVNF